jgi:RNA polymerase sigma-70 factor (ECF subfamily)
VPSAAGTDPIARKTLELVMRQDRGQLLAALIARLRDFQLAEDALHEALESALVHWGRSGIPASPQGWLLRVALRKAIDRIRRNRRWSEREADLTVLSAAESAEPEDNMSAIPDERLRLIFTCCHPALDQKSRVALTLRTLGGLTTAEIARAFLDTESTMGQRLSRAKAKIAAAGIPFAVPGPELWAERLNSVLAVIYLIFNEGYAATAGEAQVREGLCDEAIWLGRMLVTLAPDTAEALGLLSLMLTTHARRAARLDAGGALVALDKQDRGKWDPALVAEGVERLDAAIQLNAPGPYQIKAAISALHVQPPDPDQTDWRQIVLLYDALLAYEPTPIVRLNRAVALAEVGGLAAALVEIDSMAEDLDGYQPFHAARADLLSRAGRRDQARAAYERALALSGTEAERRFLMARRSALQ